jgi:hypothetical protein
VRDALPIALGVFGLFSVGGLVSDAVIISMIGLLGTLGTALITAFVYIKLGRVETKVDGKMDALLAASIGRAQAEGVTAGEQAQRDRTSRSDPS